MKSPEVSPWQRQRKSRVSENNPDDLDVPPPSCPRSMQSVHLQMCVYDIPFLQRNRYAIAALYGLYFFELREDLKPTHRVSSRFFTPVSYSTTGIYIRYLSSPVWRASTLVTINNTGINIPLRAFGNRYGYVCKTNSYTQIPSPKCKCLEF